MTPKVQLSEFHYICASLSTYSYRPPVLDALIKQFPHICKIDEWSTLNHQLYEVIDEHKLILVFRGTYHICDWGTNALLALGIHKCFSTRFAQEKEWTQCVRLHFQDYTIISCGHSLGGSLAEFVQADMCITFNKGIGIASFGKKVSDNQYDYRIACDFVSILSYTERNHNLHIHSCNYCCWAHRLSNFLAPTEELSDYTVDIDPSILSVETVSPTQEYYVTHSPPKKN